MKWKNNLRDVEPYVAGEQPKMQNLIKLNTNENPYGISLKAKEALAHLDLDRLRLYPDSDASMLRQTLAKHYQLNDDQIFVGNGSDEVLGLTFLTFFNGNQPILFPDITYSFYPVYAHLFNIDYQLVALDEKYELVEEGFKQANSGIIFPNPNAPTGIFVGVDFIERILQANPDSMVVIDEAYIDFGGESCIPLINKYDNLLVIHTFSKSRSLAGLRLGVAFGHADAIQALNHVKNSFNSYPVDLLAQTVAKAAVEDSEDMKHKVSKIIETREYTTKELKNLGFNVLESKANFVFASHPNYDAKELLQTLRKEGIIVRHFNQPRISSFLRISIGTMEQMEIFITFLKKHLI